MSLPKAKHLWIKYLNQKKFPLIKALESDKKELALTLEKKTREFEGTLSRNERETEQAVKQAGYFISCDPPIYLINWDCTAIKY